MFTVYILYSSSLDRYYIGHTENIEKRISVHNRGISAYTSKAADWELKWTETFELRELARQRELQIKKRRAGNI